LLVAFLPRYNFILPSDSFIRVIPEMFNRRTRQRYPLQLPLEYRTRHGERGTGVVIDISSRSARIELDRPHPILTEMRLNIAWPVKLNNVTALYLRMNARVDKVDQGYSIVVFKTYEFVTAGRAQFSLAGAAG
jgi:hypothetical protein